MTEYVKECRKCGNLCSEALNECPKCQTSLFGEPPIPKPSVIGLAPAATSVPPCKSEDQAEVVEPDCTDPLLYLESTRGAIYTVQNGDTVGKMHETSNAEVQLGEECDGAVHRYHCRFDFDSDHWTVLPCAQEPPRETHETFINGTLIRPGVRFLLSDGDAVQMSDTEYRIRLSL